MSNLSFAFVTCCSSQRCFGPGLFGALRGARGRDPRKQLGRDTLPGSPDPEAARHRMASLSAFPAQLDQNGKIMQN